MARADSTDLNPGGTGIPVRIEAKAGDTVDVPDNGFITHADMLRDGQDLILRAPDGETVVIENYFAVAPAPSIVAPDGSMLTPALVDSFVRSANPQFAALDQGNDESPVGVVQEVKGNATITRADGSTETVIAGMPVYQGDVIETDAEGAVNIVFVDDTSFAVSENAKLAIDEYVFDPATLSGETNFSVLRGVFVFTSGLIGREDPDDVEINTPVGSIGIRGTTIAGNAATGEIMLVEGAIVLRMPGGQEVTLATQFETARFNAQTGAVEIVGVRSAAEVAEIFSAIGSVAPGFFSAIGVSPETGAPAGPGGAAPGNGGPDGGAPAEGGAQGDDEAANTIPGADLSLDIAGTNSFSEAAESGAEPAGSAGDSPGTGAPADAGAGGGPNAAESFTVSLTLPPPPPSVTGQAQPAVPNNAAPVVAAIAPVAMAENTLAGGAVASVAATDADGNTLAYAITGGTGAGLFAIDAAGAITLTGTLDYESATTHTLDIVVSDGGFNTLTTVVVNVGDVNEAPSFTGASTISVSESHSGGIIWFLGNNSADPDAGDTLTFTKLSDPDGKFTISGTDLIMAGGLDYETQSSYSVTVRVTDSGGLTSDQTFTINLLNVNDNAVDPGINTGAAVAEDGNVLITSAMLSVTDADNPATSTLVYSATVSNGHIEVNGVTQSTFTQADIDAGVVRYFHDGSENASETISFDVADGEAGNELTAQTFTITVTPQNDAPVLAAGAAIAMTAIDEDDANSAGDDVAALLAGEFTDAEGAAEGMAIVAADESNGVWEYSNDGGATWAAVGAVSVSAALLLTSTDLVRFVPDADYNGTATLQVKGWDQSAGTAYGTADTAAGTAFSANSRTLEISVDPLDDAPVIDLNGVTAGSNYAADFDEAVGEVNITDAGVAITDADGDNIDGAEIIIDNPVDGASEYLFIEATDVATLAGYGITVTVNGTGDSLSLSGTATAAQYREALGMIKYTNTLDAPDLTDRVIEIFVTDETAIDSATYTSTISIIAIDDDDTIVGTADNEIYQGDGGNDVFEASAGDDDYHGAGGTNTLDMSAGTEGADIDLLTGDVFNNGFAGVGVISDVQNVTGTAYDDMITGNTDDNEIYGGDGADTLTTGGGNNTIVGEDGDDEISVSAADGTNFLDGGAGTDMYSAAGLTGPMTLDLTAGTATVDRGGGNTDTLSNFEIYVLGTGADIIIAKTGINADIDGQIGVDEIDFSAASMALDIALDTGIAQAASSPTWAYTLAEIENVKGSAQDDIIKGDAANNTLRGGGGNDRLFGGGGNNTLDGGTGAGDEADYSGATAAINVDMGMGANQVSANGEGGMDTLTGIEIVTGSAFADIMKGATGSYELRGGAGNDTLYGFDGNKVIGGADSDTFYIFSGGGSVVIDGGAGDDTVEITQTGPNKLHNITGVETIDAAGAAANLDIKLGAGALTGNIGGKMVINLNADDILNLDLTAFTGGDRFAIDGGATVQGSKLVLESGGLGQTIEIDYTAGTELNIDVVPPGGGDVYLNLLPKQKGYWIHDDLGEGFGHSLAGLGDIDGDGFEDVGVVKGDHTTDGVIPSFMIMGAAGLQASGKLPDFTGASKVETHNFGLAGGDNNDDLQITGIGDFNGDGVDDYAVSAPFGNDKINSNTTSGTVRIVSGATNAVMISSTAVELEVGGALTSNLFGAAIAHAGDVNNDGYDDILIAAPQADAGNTNTGTVFLLFGDKQADLTDFDITGLSASQGFAISGLNIEDMIGTTVTSAGDFNNDGIDDFMFSVVKNAGNTVGEAYIVLGQEGMTSVDLATEAIKIGGISMNSSLPVAERDMPLMNLGDINGDGATDLAVGVADTKSMHILHGGAGETAGANTLAGMTDITVTADASHDIVGAGGVGDFNGDGFDDFAVAMLDGAARRADIYVVYGGDGLPGTIDMAYLNAPANTYHMVYDIAAGVDVASFAVNITAAGDMNGDGYKDLALGMTGIDANPGINSDGAGNMDDDKDGSVAIIYGRDSGAGGLNLTGTSAAAGERLVGSAANETLTQSSDTHGDLVYRAGAGNDVIVLKDANFMDMDGGTGIDKIDFLTPSETLDFSTFSAEEIRGMEGINLGGSNQTLVLTLQNVLDFMKTMDGSVFKIDALDSTSQLDINTAGGPVAGADEAAIFTALGAEGSATLNAGFWEFNIGGNTLQIDQVLVDNGKVDIV